jgi:hypothetical protein
MAICPSEVDTKTQQDVDQGYYRNNKHKMLKPKTVAEKFWMIFEERLHYETTVISNLYRLATLRDNYCYLISTGLIIFHHNF